MNFVIKDFSTSNEIRRNQMVYETNKNLNRNKPKAKKLIK